MSRCVTRVGVYVDGDFYARVFSHYLTRHSRRAPLSLAGVVGHGLAAFARYLKVEPGNCKVVASRYICGRSSDGRGEASGSLAERDARRQGFWIQEVGGSRQRDAIPVALAVEALDDAVRLGLDGLILLCESAAFVPFARKVSQNGTAVIVPAFDFVEGGRGRRIRTASALLEEALLPLPLGRLIENAASDDPEVKALFLARPAPAEERTAAAKDGPKEPARKPAAQPMAQRDTAAKAPAGELSGVVEDLRGKMGFLREDWNGAKLFFHHTAVAGEIDGLTAGVRVLYERGVDPRDRPCAINVRPDVATEAAAKPAPEAAPEPAPEPAPADEPAPEMVAEPVVEPAEELEPSV
jgi:cold shock CspA family protein